MVKTRILSSLFIILTLACVGYGIVIVIDEMNYQTGVFTNDGYALVLDSKKNKTDVLSFQSGTKYNFKKYNNKVGFSSNDGSVKVDDSTVVHYEDNSLLVLKDTVGINLNNVDSNVVFYYNIFKNTHIKYDDGKYSIDLADKNKITFDQLLLRITDTKFLLVGNNIRALLSKNEVVSFDNYVYFEYTNGSVVKIYNNERYYQTIATDSSIISGDITINLLEETISKQNKKCISLSNLVIDMDSNIDVIASEKEEPIKIDVDKSEVDPDSVKSGEGVDGSDNSLGADGSSEQIVDEGEKSDEPVYKITKMSLTSLKIDATIEIEDKDSLLSSPTTISIVENGTAKTVYEMTTEEGELYGYVSYPNLKPDTEYTLYAKASYKIDDVTYDKTFISKIFRTEALGVNFDSSLVTKNAITIDVNKEIYSKVNAVNIGIYDPNGNEIDSKNVEFKESNSVSLTFDGLNNNTSYMIKMYDILSSGVIIDNGYSVKKTVKTLKEAPSVGNLEYSIDKRESKIILNAFNVVDKDYGITNYRYEVFDAREDLENSKPIVTINKNKLDKVSLNVDDVNIHHGIAYTYRLIVEFFDNEKTVEYEYNLGSTMQIDGVEFPTLRWEGTNITWEQINGAIIVDDPSGTIMSNKYRVVYKNSLGTYTTMSLTSETSTNNIPIAINYLRANETYTFDVYASINLQDGNPTVNEAYIGSVKVQTKAPNPLNANFQDNIFFTTPFAVDFNLSNANKDASLEASTLSTITFTLYQGSTTDGMVEVYRKTTDGNISEYISSLKNEFYDNKAIIDAKFFNTEPSAFKQKTYTLVVDDAYDYTGYNKIPIENNVYQFKTNAYIPDVPNAEEPQIMTHAILNKFAADFGLKVNNDLDANTVVGYSVNSIFDNTSQSGKYILYHVWRYNQNTHQFELVPGLDKRVDFNADGTQPNAIFPVGNGTSDTTLDSDMLRRGNSYYFSYEVYIDMDGDGTAETVYPKAIQSQAVLKSAVLQPKKQSSNVVMYPSVSDLNTFTWKYKISDIDNSLSTNKLFAFVDSNADFTSYAEISRNSSDFNSVVFTGLNKGNILTVKKSEKLLKNSEMKYSNVTSQYFYGYRSDLSLTYTVDNDVNKMLIVLDNYLNKADEISSIAKLDVVITPTNKADLDRLGQQTISNVIIDNGIITIDYEKISKYMNVEIGVELVAYFDTDATGFDLDSDYKVIQKGTYNEPGNYYILNDNKLNQTPMVYGTMVTSTFKSDNKVLELTNIKNQNSSIKVDIDNTGVIYQNNNILLKGIKMQKLNSSNNKFKFDYIIPSISLSTKDNKVNIMPLLTGAKIKAKLVDEYKIIKDNDVYIELFEVDKNGLNATYVDTFKKKVSDFDDQIELSNLKLHTNYFVKFYANIYDSNTHTYNKTYLYDADQKITGCNYNFHTLSNVGISNVTGELISNSYSDKRLVINYNADNTIGYDYIKYTLYKLTENGYEELNVDIPDSKVFMNNMKVEVSASPSEVANISYGDTYKIKMDIYSNYVINGEKMAVLLETDDAEFVLNDYEEPFVGISSGKTDDSIFFRVSVIDSSHLIVNGVYTAVLTDSKGNVIANVNHQSIDTFNKKFVFNKDDYNLVDGEEYTFTVSVKADYNNSGNNIQNIASKRTIKYGANVYLGTITLAPGNNNNINMVFTNSYQLSLIDKVSYTISNDSESYAINATTPFNIHYDKESDAYYYTIEINDDNFNPNLLYLVTINFFSGNELIESAELGYGGHS